MPWSLSTSRRRACCPWTSAEGLSGIWTTNLGGRRKTLKSLSSDQNAEVLRNKIWFDCWRPAFCQWGLAWHQKVRAVWWYWTLVKTFLNLGKACLRFIGCQQFRIIMWPLSPLPHRNVWISVRHVPTGVSSTNELISCVCWTSYRNSFLRFCAFCGHRCACFFHHV